MISAVRDRDSELGRGGHWKPSDWSQISLFRAALESAERHERDMARARHAIDSFMKTYWAPVYQHFRRKWGLRNEDAKDMTQDFFASILTSGFMSRADPANGRFRTYVRKALDDLARDHFRSKRRLKRGGDGVEVPLGEVEAPAPESAAPGGEFDRDWARAVLEKSVGQAAATFGPKRALVEQLLKPLIDPPPRGRHVLYVDLARRFRMTSNGVAVLAHRARAKCAEFVRQNVGSTVRGTAADVQAEIDALFAEGSLVRPRAAARRPRPGTSPRR